MRASMPTNVVIRPARPTDTAAFKKLNRQTFLESLPEDTGDREALASHYETLFRQFAPFDQNRNTILVADVDGSYAGHLWFGLQTDFFTGRAKAWIFDVSVRPEYRRQGIGKQLLQAGTAQMKEQGYDDVGLQVFARNEPALALYRSLGFDVRSSVLSLRL